MSDEELLSLRDSVIDEIEERGIGDEYPFSAGIYTVGKDIKAGSYNLHFSDVTKTALIFVYGSSKDAEDKNPLFSEIIKAPGLNYHIQLEEGMVFEITQQGEAKIKISIQDDAPWKP